MNTTQNPAPEEPSSNQSIPEEAIREYEALSKNRVEIRERMLKAFFDYQDACDKQSRYVRKLVKTYGKHRLEFPGFNFADNEILSAYRNGYQDSIRDTIYGQIEITEEKEEWRASKINLNQVIVSGMIVGVGERYSLDGNGSRNVHLIPISTLEELESFQNKTHPVFNKKTNLQRIIVTLKVTGRSLKNRLAPKNFFVGLGSITGGSGISILGSCFRIYTTLEEFLEDPQNQLVVSYYKVSLPF